MSRGKGGKADSPSGKGRRAPGDSKSTPKGSGGPRVPAITMIPVGLAVGWFAAGWLGAIFGGVVGVFLWRSRA